MVLTLEKFLKDIEKHEINILKDDGLYRHLLVKKPGTICQSFNIVTAPGVLFYYGDMGSFTFSRLEDMFNFFRDKDLKINAGYWSEKIYAVDRHSGYKEFSFDLFKENLFDYCTTEEQKQFIKEELEHVEEDEFGAVAFYRDFDNDNEVGVDLSDFWECCNTKMSFRYLWCCYAMVWTINEYDKIKSNG